MCAPQPLARSDAYAEYAKFAETRAVEAIWRLEPSHTLHVWARINTRQHAQREPPVPHLPQLETDAQLLQAHREVGSMPAAAMVTSQDMTPTKGVRNRKLRTCYQCKESWFSQKGKTPMRCPFCHTRAWDRALGKAGRPRKRIPKPRSKRRK